jgi:TRAP-type C4-dicarboxylate transport system substrate-binding protein
MSRFARWTSWAGFLILLLTVACGGGGTTSEETDDATVAPGPTDAGTDAPEATDGTDAAEPGEAITLRYSSPIPAETSLGESFEWWASEVTSRTDGRITVELFHAAELVAATETLGAVQSGRADIGYVPDAFHPAEFPLWSVSGVPFVTGDAGASIRSFAELAGTNEAFQQQFADAGVHPLLFMPLGAGGCGSSDEIDQLEDFEGLRIRSFGYTAEALDAIGADPVFLDTAEVFEALQRDTIDAFCGFFLDAAVGVGLHEVAPRFIDTGLGQYASVGGLMNLDVWESLSPEDQQVLTEVSEEYVDVALDNLDAYATRACDTLVEEGGSVTVLPEAEVARWEETAGDTLVESWKGAAIEAGADEAAVDEFLAQRLETVEQFEAESDYVEGLQACAERT